MSCIGKMDPSQALKICQKCKATCCKMGGPDFNKKEMNKVLDSGAKDCFRKIGKDHYELISKKGICPYLSKENSCLIHEVRPNMCKSWPVYLRFIDGKRRFVLVDCPLTNHLDKKDIQLMKRQAAKIPKKIIENTFSDTKISKSDLNLIEKRFNRFKKKDI